MENEEIVKVGVVDELCCGVADGETVLGRDLMKPHDGVEVERKFDAVEDTDEGGTVRGVCGAVEDAVVG